MVATELGKEHAQAALAERRANRPTLPRNEDLPAGSPMYFACIGCGAAIVVPEDWTSKPEACRECMALLALGWFEK